MLAEWKSIEQFALNPVVYRRRIEKRKRDLIEQELKARARERARRKKLKL